MQQGVGGAGGKGGGVTCIPPSELLQRIERYLNRETEMTSVFSSHAFPLKQDSQNDHF